MSISVKERRALEKVVDDLQKSYFDLHTTKDNQAYFDRRGDHFQNELKFQRMLDKLQEPEEKR